MKRGLVLACAVVVAPLLAGCGGGSAGPHPSSAPGEAQPPHRTPTSPFVPRSAVVRPAPWHLPVAEARQALVALPRGQALVAGGLIAGDRSTGQAMRVDLQRGRVRELPALAVPVHDVAGGLLGSTPIVVGGGSSVEQDAVQVLRHGRWSVLGHLPTTRSDLAVVEADARPLVLGGYDGIGTPTAILALDPHGRSRPFGRLALGTRYAATAVLGHTAYLFGGEVLGHELDAVQAVDLRTGRTRVVAHLPMPLGHAMAARVGRRVLLMGGRVAPDRQTAAMWWFDPATGRFSPAGHLPQARSDAAVASYRHRVWLLGGEDPAVTDGVLTVSVR